MKENEEITQENIFESDAEKEMGISTTVYKNGNKVKIITLSSGKKAVVRELFGRDAKETNRRVNGNQEDYINAQISVATKIDDKPITLEEIDDLPNKDYNKLMVANSSLNF